MRNSESKLSKHLGRLRVKRHSGCSFIVILLLQEQSYDFSFVIELNNQSFREWELLIAFPPGADSVLPDSLSPLIANQRVSCVSYGDIDSYVSTSSCEYIAFIQQESLWHNERLSHDIYLLDKYAGAAVCSPPLIWSHKNAPAYVPSVGMYGNKLVAGYDMLRYIRCNHEFYFGIDTTSFRREEFIKHTTKWWIAPTLAALKFLLKGDIYCSDKCLSERKLPGRLAGEELADAAQELLLSCASCTEYPRSEVDMKLQEGLATAVGLHSGAEQKDAHEDVSTLRHTNYSDDVSVIVPFLNPGYNFKRFLNSLLEQDSCPGELEFILIDNGSTDGSRILAKEFLQRRSGKLVDAHNRRNASYARNVGVQASSCSKLLFADADDELAPGYIEAMVAALHEHEYVCSAVDDISLNEKWVQEAHGGRWTGLIPRAFGFLDSTGTNVGMRRSLFDKIGGWPEDMSGAQDIVFSWRAQLLGGATVVLVPSAIYRYRFRHSIASLFRQTQNWGKSNALLYRHFRGHGMPGRSIRMTLSDWRRAFRSLAGARSKSDFARAASLLGSCTGRLIGSLRYRVQYL